jgi:amino acid transporter
MCRSRKLCVIGSVLGVAIFAILLIGTLFYAFPTKGYGNISTTSCKQTDFSWVWVAGITSTLGIIGAIITLIWSCWKLHEEQNEKSSYETSSDRNI